MDMSSYDELIEELSEIARNIDMVIHPIYLF